MVHISLTNLFMPLFIVTSGFLCLEFSIPIAMGEFAAGIIGGTFIEKEQLEWVEYFSHLGLLSIMFLAGFEVEVKVLKKHLRTNLIVGSLSFFAPFLLVVGVSLFYENSLIQSTILGIACSTTSLAIVFSVLRESGTIQTDRGQVILGSAMIVDLFSMIFLSLIFFDFTLRNLLFTAILLAVLLTMRKLIMFVFQRYRGNRVELELKTMLLMILAVGMLAEGAGIHAATIAFTAGVMFSDIDPDHEEIMSKLSTVVFSLLGPIFFFHAGMNLDLSQVTSDSILFLAIIAAVAIFGKFMGTALGLYYFYEKSLEIARYGGALFNYRLSFGIVTAMYAYERKVIDITIFNTILLVVAISSVFTVLAQRRQERNSMLVSDG